MDIKIDNEFKIIFNNDLKIVDGLDERKQRLLLYLKTPIGSLYDKNYGLDFNFFIKLLKNQKEEEIKIFFCKCTKNPRYRHIKYQDKKKE
ncbi:hypothetical protein BDCR2A_01207 [Borrelia duttonii CR2A]|uniref:Uncharacterized protein n=1 Tax=Borrelia duttonii CR2A TaxID=1432657 RepID=W6TGG7_9SPIR|nr:DUF2634 domain-containing protein [Borrelia duttonii]ETZ18012.1 hypothetical protein BDCR2A_01207 [Borrelia duttonii CR2A]